MADRINLATVGTDDHHAHDAARRRFDIGRIGLGGCGKYERKQEREKA